MAAAKKSGVSPVPPSFEAALEELESLVRRMENGELPLEASLQAYERGVSLIKSCQARLEGVQQQVNVLEGELIRPMTPVDDAPDAAP